MSAVSVTPLLSLYRPSHRRQICHGGRNEPKQKRRGSPPPFRRSVSGERLPLNTGADDIACPCQSLFCRRAGRNHYLVDAALMGLAIHILSIGIQARCYTVGDAGGETAVVALRPVDHHGGALLTGS